MGKLITFWSPYRGQAGVTSTMCAIAGGMGIEYPELEIALSHVWTDSVELEKRLDGRIGRTGTRDFFDKTGITALKMNYRQEVLTPEKIRRCAVPLLMKSLYLFPGSRQEKQDEIGFQIMTKKLVQEFAMTFLDLESGWSENSLRLMKEADMVVVVLPQQPDCWEQFLETSGAELGEKKVGLILGGYLGHSRYSPGYFSRKKWGKAVWLGAIPRNTGYMDAMTEGRTLDYFLKNESVGKNEENYEFIIQAKRTAECLKENVDGKKRHRL